MIDNYKNSVPSPYGKTQEKKSPIQEELDKSIGTFNLTAIVKEDTDTASQLSHIPGLISLICTLKLGDKVIGIGRGSATLNRMNRVVERGVRYSFGNALVDAVVRGVKNLDTLYFQSTNQGENNFTSSGVLEDEPASDKQKSYLQKLITLNITDIKERNKWELELNQLTKNQASDKIKALIN
ncbi:MAG: hypothetical protein NTZ44_01910 [Candidatus Nomurabacteria bacterium]|nr:hypothetical protein [Candidatus Nomurabacteria bacterium]